MFEIFIKYIINKLLVNEVKLVRMNKAIWSMNTCIILIGSEYRRWA